MKKLFLSTISLVILFFFLIPFCLKGQDLSNDYKPIRSFRPSPELLNDYHFKFGSWGQKNDIEKEKVKQTFIKFVEQKSDFIRQLDSLNVLMYKDSISGFLNLIKDNIVKGNPSLSGHDFKIFTYRNNEPNAFNLGEGMILVSTGLLERISNHDQLAFVISHEMAHDVMDHVFLNLQHFTKSIHDTELKKTFQKTARKKVGRNTSLKNLMNNFMSIHMRYSQQREYQADSLGYVYFRNAGYNTAEAIKALEMLEHSDQLRFEDTLDLRHHFHFSDYPFKAYWLDQSNSMINWEVDTTLYRIPDSLKSHPGCDLRIDRLLNETSPGEDLQRDHLSEVRRMDQLAPVFPFEVIESIMNSRDYVMALYLSLHMQNQYPENIYLKCVTANCLFELGEAMVRNEFLEFVEFQDKEYPAGYNQLLIFLHNMTSSSLRNLFKHYLARNLNDAGSNSYIGYLKLLGDQLPLTPDGIEDYKKEYQDNHYVTLLEQKIKSVKTGK